MSDAPRNTKPSLNTAMLPRDPHPHLDSILIHSDRMGNETASLARKSTLSGEEVAALERDLERAIVQAIEKDPSVIEALLRDSAALAKVDKAPLDGGPVNAIEIGDELTNVLKSVGRYAYHVLRDKRMPVQKRMAQSEGWTSFEKVVNMGILPNVVDYVVRNHGHKVSSMLRPGNDSMLNILRNAATELASTGKLRPFDPATMNVSSPTEAELGRAIEMHDGGKVTRLTPAAEAASLHLQERLWNGAQSSDRMGGIPPMESLGIDLHAAGSGGMKGQDGGVVFTPSLALRSRFPPDGGWLGDNTPGKVEPIQGIPSQDVLANSAADRTAARFELERAMIVAIERDPRVAEDLLAAHTSDDPAVMAKGDAILDATAQGLHPDLLTAGGIKQAVASGSVMTPFERLAYRGDLTSVADYLIRNHGQDIAQRLANGSQLAAIAGSPEMYGVLRKAKEELSGTGTLRPFDLASMGISAKAPATDRSLDSGTSNSPSLK
jgi:hypothetical protein